jgi:YHS domain-containing protein
MKIFRILFLALAAAGVAAAAQGKAINDVCPIKAGTPAKPGITSMYKGKTIAFCCGNCKGQFDADPEKYAASIPGLAGPQPRSALNSLEEGLKSGKDGTKPVVVLFMDAGPKSKAFSEMLGDPSLDESFGKVAYAAVEFKKDDETCKKLKVTAAPTLLILDPRGEEPKEIKKMAGGAPPTIKKEIDAAVKKLASK